MLQIADDRPWIAIATVAIARESMPNSCVDGRIQIDLSAGAGTHRHREQFARAIVTPAPTCGS